MIHIDDALVYIRQLQPQAMANGWCLMLGGGVLNRGESDSDVDLLAYPRTVASTRGALLRILPTGGEWYDVGVADVYCYTANIGKVELIFQTFSAPS